MRLVITAVLTALLSLSGSAAQAAFPGENGRILQIRDGDLWTSELDGSNPLRLTATPGETELNARWSPDGRRIVYELRSSDPDDFGVINADGSGDTRIAVPGDGAEPAWASDGQRIVYVWSVTACDAHSCWVVDEGTNVMNVDGSGNNRITRFTSNPVWSPDGSKIAFGAGDIWTIDPDGSGEVDLTPGTDPLQNIDWYPDWSPDGQRLVFQRVCCQLTYDLVSIKRDGTDLRQLTSSAMQETRAIWSPDGSKIVFDASKPDHSGHLGTFVMNSDGTGVTQLPFDAGLWDWQPIVPSEPICSYVTASPRSLFPADRSLPKVRLTAPSGTSRDPVTIEITGVTQDEPTGGLRDALRVPRADRVRLRAEHSRSGDGRVYEIAYAATDATGGECSGVVSVEVPVEEGVAAVNSTPPSYDSFSPTTGP